MLYVSHQLLHYQMSHHNESLLLTVGHLCYNTGHYVIDAIRSVQASAPDGTEQIVIDDGSSDESVELLERFIESSNQNIRLIKNKKNLGINASKNRVVSEAKGKYYYSIGDDLVLPDKFQKDIALLEQSDESVFAICSLSQIFYEDPSDLSHEHHGSHPLFNTETVIPAEDLLQSLTLKNWIAAPTVVFKTQWLKTLEYPSDFFIEDYPYWVFSAIQGKTMLHRPETSVLYRRGKHSISRQHYQSQTALKIHKDCIRCRIIALDALGDDTQTVTIIRDGVNILRYGDDALKKWYRLFIAENNCRGIIYYGSAISQNKYFMRALLHLSSRTQRI